MEGLDMRSATSVPKCKRVLTWRHWNHGLSRTRPSYGALLLNQSGSDVDSREMPAQRRYPESNE